MRTLLADQHPEICLALAIPFGKESGATVLGSVSEIKGLLALVETPQSGIIILNSRLPGTSTADLLTTLRSEIPPGPWGKRSRNQLINPYIQTNGSSVLNRAQRCLGDLTLSPNPFHNGKKRKLTPVSKNLPSLGTEGRGNEEKKVTTVLGRATKQIFQGGNNEESF
jgi:hypothetical protein